MGPVVSPEHLKQERKAEKSVREMGEGAKVNVAGRGHGESTHVHKGKKRWWVQEPSAPSN